MYKGLWSFKINLRKETLSGIGASIKSDHIENASIDIVKILSEDDIVEGCKELLEEELIFTGASSGAAYIACKEYKEENPDDIVLFICPDSGMTYINSVYK